MMTPFPTSFGKTMAVLASTSLLFGATAWSQGLAENRFNPNVPSPPAEPTPVNTGRLSFGGGLDITSKYFFRGLLQEDQGLIAQPWAETTVTLHEGKGAVNNFGVTLGIWNSFHSEGTLANTASSVDGWYEADLYIGASATWFENWTTGVTYTAYTSPSDAFQTVHEVAFGLSYDDSALWKKGRRANSSFTGLQPSITVAVEVDNSVVAPDEGVYLEVKFEPGFDTFFEIQHRPITVKFPVVVGFSISDYYEDSTGDDHFFGYFDAGMILSYPLTAFIPTEYGAWEIAGGVRFLFLADTTENLNNGDSTDIVGTVGLSVAY